MYSIKNLEPRRRTLHSTTMIFYVSSQGRKRHYFLSRWDKVPLRIDVWKIKPYQWLFKLSCLKAISGKENSLPKSQLVWLDLISRMLMGQLMENFSKVVTNRTSFFHSIEFHSYVVQKCMWEFRHVHFTSVQISKIFEFFYSTISVSLLPKNVFIECESTRKW